VAAVATAALASSAAAAGTVVAPHSFGPRRGANVATASPESPRIGILAHLRLRGIMDNPNLIDAIALIDEAIDDLRVREKVERDRLDKLSELQRDLTEQEQRQEQTAHDRTTALQAEILELGRQKSALWSSRVPLVRNVKIGRDIKALKVRLEVEDNHRDDFDQLERVLLPHEKRREKIVKQRCAGLHAQILNLRRQETARQSNPTASVPDVGGSSLQCTYEELMSKVLSPIRVASPVRAGSDALLRSALASFSLDGPVFLHPAVVGDPLSAIRKLNLPLDGLLDEGRFDNLAASLLPAWVRAVGERSSITDTKSATALYGGADAVSSFRPVSLPWGCNPELHVRSGVLHPGFNAEVKSIGSKHTWNELLTYVTMSMVDSLFTGTSLHRFYATPPVGYGLVCFPYCGYFVAVEWVGKLFATPFSQPFFLGSDQHKDALAALPDISYKEFVDLDSSKVEWDIRSSRKVSWATVPTELHTGQETLLCNQFVKVITCSAFDAFLQPAGFFRRLYRTYRTYRATWDEASDKGELHLVPEALVQANLWYGIFAVAVTMDFIVGREATSLQLQASSSADEQGVRAISKAVVWLARRGLIYYDLREPNIVVVADGSWRLVDYDDMVVVDPGTVTSVADMKQVLQDENARVPGVMAAFQGFPKLIQFIDDAFQDER